MTRAKKNETAETPKDPSRKSSTELREVEWGGFINLRLSERQKDDFKAWFADNNTFVTDKLAEMLIDGGKLSFSFSRDNDTFSCTLTGMLLRSSDKRYGTSAYARDWWTAAALLVYKHYVVAETNWDDFRPKTQTFDDLG